MRPIVPLKYITWRDDTDEFHFVRPHIDLPPIAVSLIISNESISLSILFFLIASMRMSFFDIRIFEL